MKKKIMSLLLASAVAVTALGLTACNDDDGSDVLKSEKVASAAAWKAAFDFSEITNASMYCKGADEEETMERTAKLDGKKFMSMQSYGEDYYYEDYCEYKPDELMKWEVDGEMYGTLYYYTYDEDTEKWGLSKQAAFDGDVVDDFLHEIDEIDHDYTPARISESYDLFTYDETNYEYVATWSNFKKGHTTTTCTVTIKIKDGKLAEGTYSGTRTYEDEVLTESETMTASFKVYDIGTTIVTLPNAEA